MTDENHLSQIETRWETLFQAHAGDDQDETTRARARLLNRYRGAVHRYLLAITKDPERAADLAQEFAVKVLTGAFRNADPRRGRFRDFLKRAVVNLLRDQQRSESRSKANAPLIGDAEPAVDPDDAWTLEHDEAFLKAWREDLIAKSWADLLAFQERYEHPYHDVLRLRTDQGWKRSSKMDPPRGILSVQNGPTVTASV